MCLDVCEYVSVFDSTAFEWHSWQNYTKVGKLPHSHKHTHVNTERLKFAHIHNTTTHHPGRQTQKRHLQYISTKIAKDKLFFALSSIQHPDSVYLMCMRRDYLQFVAHFSAWWFFRDRIACFSLSLSLSISIFHSPLLHVVPVKTTNRSWIKVADTRTHTHTHAGISVWTCVWACECESVCSHSHFMYQTDDACAFDSNCKSIVPFRSAGEFVNELRYDIFPFCIHFSFHIPADTIIFTRHHYRLLVVPNRLTISISSHIHTHTRTYTPKKERE